MNDYIGGYDFIGKKKPQNEVDPKYFDNDIDVPYVKPKQKKPPQLRLIKKNLPLRLEKISKILEYKIRI